MITQCSSYYSIISSRPPSYHEKEPITSSSTTPTRGWVDALKPEQSYSYQHVRTGSTTSVNLSPRSSMERELPEDRFEHSPVGSRSVSPTPGNTMPTMPTSMPMPMPSTSPSLPSSPRFYNRYNDPFHNEM